MMTNFCKVSGNEILDKAKHVRHKTDYFCLSYQFYKSQCIGITLKRRSIRLCNKNKQKQFLFFCIRDLVYLKCGLIHKNYESNSNK